MGTTAESLDDYLAKGYFRTGHTLRQTSFVYVDGEMYSTVWSRVPLDDYELTKSQRRLQRRVEAKYKFSFEPYRTRRDQDELYERYRSAHPLEVGESLGDIFGYHHPVLDFRTFLLRIELDGRLVAFSCFDRGDHSLASLLGCYEPSLARESLGFATMLFEMAYGHEHGYHYYYPGYCVPGLAPFAYKMRLPNLHGLTSRHQEWRPMPALLSKPLPKEELSAALSHLATCLSTRGIDCRLLVMPLADNLPNVHGIVGPMPHSLMLSVAEVVPLGETLVAFDLVTREYELWLASPQASLLDDPFMAGLLDDFPKDADLRLFGWRIPIYRTADISALLKYLTPGKMITRLLSRE